MKRLSLLIKPASSLCNMRCRYCFYADISSSRIVPSYGIMDAETRARIIDNVFKDLEDGDEVTFAFQGGEPTLAGLPYFEKFVEHIAAQKRKVIIHYAFQTNGLLIDDEWASFFHKNNFLLGLSLDGGERFHDRNRLDAKGEGTWNRILQSKKILEAHQAEYNILTVLTNETANEPDKVWRFIQNEKIAYIQFIPCLEDLEGQDDSKNALRPARFAHFYSRLFYWWSKELEQGRYISVKFFDDIVNYFFKGIPTACGINGQCSAQYVVEADGSVYPCDFYVLDKYNLGNLADLTLREIFETEKMHSFLSEKPETPPICGGCKYFKLCRGGCKRMRNVQYYGEAGVVCGNKIFLDKCLEPLEHTVKRYFSR
ncbi:radical SAM/SPASM domain-containing protein [Spirochaetia bacterium]|nr:radical SAM/SPASM domain-containing protein [Spirochaetia bacterium]